MSVEPRRVELDELPGLVGESFGGIRFSVTRTERNTFEALTGVTEVYDETELPEFPADIVEGFHVLSLVDPLSMKLLRVNAETSYAYNYGLDRVRFIEPILIGQELEFSFEVSEVSRKGEGYLMLRSCRIEHLENRERPAMTADWKTLSLPGGDR